MIRTVTLPHLHLFGIEDGLELQVSLLPCSDRTLVDSILSYLDQEARCSTPWRWTSSLPLSGSQEREDFELCRAWKD